MVQRPSGTAAWSTKVERATLVPLAPDLKHSPLPSSGHAYKVQRRIGKGLLPPPILEKGICGFSKGVWSQTEEE